MAKEKVSLEAARMRAGGGNSGGGFLGGLLNIVHHGGQKGEIQARLGSIGDDLGEYSDRILALQGEYGSLCNNNALTGGSGDKPINEQRGNEILKEIKALQNAGQKALQARQAAQRGQTGLSDDMAGVPSFKGSESGGNSSSSSTGSSGDSGVDAWFGTGTGNWGQ